MVITTPTSNNINLIADETDFKNNEISLKELISNPQKTNNFIEKLLLNYSKDLKLNSYSIFTHNFKIFYIKIILNNN